MSRPGTLPLPIPTGPSRRPGRTASELLLLTRLLLHRRIGVGMRSRARRRHTRVRETRIRRVQSQLLRAEQEIGVAAVSGAWDILQDNAWIVGRGGGGDGEGVGAARGWWSGVALVVVVGVVGGGEIAAGSLS